MKERGRYRFPSVSALIAFETVARNGSFSRAAEELGTSQSAVSRHIAALESQLSTRLFVRSRAGATLTGAGQVFIEAVVTGLGAIQAGAEEVANRPDGDEVVIAGSHDALQFVVFPRYDALKDAVGEQVKIRFATFQYPVERGSIDPSADVVLTWNATSVAPNAAQEDTVQVFREEVQLVCSPDYAATHEDTLGGPMAGWSGLTFLDLETPGAGWASWSDWFEAKGVADPTSLFERFDSYIQVLEAATAGRGIAMGWRHCIERYIESGAVEMLDRGFVEFENSLLAVLTEKGRKNPNARKCLSSLGLRWPQDSRS